MNECLCFDEDGNPEVCTSSHKEEPDCGYCNDRGVIGGEYVSYAAGHEPAYPCPRCGPDAVAPAGFIVCRSTDDDEMPF